MKRKVRSGVIRCLKMGGCGGLTKSRYTVQGSWKKKDGGGRTRFGIYISGNGASGSLSLISLAGGG